MITVLICGGVWLLGAAATAVLSAYLEVKEDGTLDSIPEEWVWGMAAFWPIILVLGVPLFGTIFLREALVNRISARRKAKKQEPKLRIQPTSKELDYRTMPCISCEHTVEKEPHEREARSSTL